MAGNTKGMRFRYVAHFAGGVTREIKNSRRHYTHAWRVVCEKTSNSGFAASKDHADRAVRAECAFLTRIGHTVIATEIVDARIL